MVSFLSELAKEIYAHHGSHLDKICIVFQNRRACLYFKHLLAEEIVQTTWAPKVLTIEEFVMEFHAVQIMDSSILLFEFYNVYKQRGGTDSFEQFAQWGDILLKDFDEIDAYLVSADQLFHHLNEAKAIEQWDPEGKTLSDFQLQYLRYWESLNGLYHSLRAHLTERNCAYKGMAMRHVAETIEETISQKPWKEIIFAGFNALSLSEEKIFKSLLKLKRARVIWDMDAYYIRNDSQEAGHYIRKYLREWNIENRQWEKDFLLSEKKNIQIIGVSKQVGQAKVAGDLVQKLQNQNRSIQDTAIILADESLLFPVLHSLPDSVKDINVSMGLSLKFTPLFSLVESLFTMHERAHEFDEHGGSDEIKFYHKDVIAILSHPLIQWTDRQDNFPYRQLIMHIIENNILFISDSEINEFLSSLNPAYNNVFLKPWNCSSDILESLTEILTFFYERTVDQKSNRYDLESESIFRFHTVIRQVQDLLSSYSAVLEMKSVRVLLTEILTSTRIPFSGEPLKGLQVMGMLETRTIDFENVILLSVNENTLPASKTQQSMIPFDIKKTFRLPTYKEKDAIFAYNFYRSIQRAKNIYLIYNSETDDFGKGERSRFITQLIHEWPKYNRNIRPENIQESFLSVATSPVPTADFEITKNDAVITEIDKLFEKGISPSALNSYINCSLKFYLRYIVRLNEADKTEETIEAGTFGSVVHYVLENLFKPYEGKTIHAADIETMLEKYRPMLSQALKYYLKNGDVHHGKNHLLARVALKLIGNFLNYEKARIDAAEQNGSVIRILGLEKEVSCDYNLQLNDREKIVRLKGKMDRIEDVGGKLLLIDYKTGMVENKELKVDAFFDIVNDPTLAKSFQLLMYGYIYTQSLELTDFQMVSAIYPFKKLSEGLKKVKVKGSEILNLPVFKAFEEPLKDLLTELLDPSKPFKQTENPDRCRYCEFTSFCLRD